MLKALIRCPSCEHEYKSDSHPDTGYATEPCTRCGAFPGDENDEDPDRMEK